MYYDFDDFVNSVKYLNKDDILATAYKKHKALDKVSVKEKKEGGFALQDKISGLLLLLEKQQRSPYLNETDFAKLKPLCKSLIEKNELDKQTMDLF